MSVFRVWAPAAERVEVQLGAEAMGGGAPEPMRPAATPGWWDADLQEVSASGTDYAFRVDGGEPLPDPRSPWQPLGHRGPEPHLRSRGLPVDGPGLAGRAAARRGDL